jgi:hypothetical protein
MNPTDNKSIVTKNAETNGFFDMLNYFAEDKSFVFIFKKTQKLATALYLITGFFGDSEPLKWKLRTLGSKLIEVNLALKDSSNNPDSAITSMRSVILEISSLLLVSKQSGLVSEMNYAIISKEFSSLADSLTLSSEFKTEGDREIREDFFKVTPEAQTVPMQKAPIALQEVSLIPESMQETVVEKDILKDHKIDEAVMARMGKPAQATSSIDSSPKPLKDYGVVAVKKNSRQSIIIGLLKRKKEIMIKDVSPLIQGCSEKTIQRELLAMVDAGILRKVGEKRWSRYSLV